MLVCGGSRASEAAAEALLSVFIAELTGTVQTCDSLTKHPAPAACAAVKLRVTQESTACRTFKIKVLTLTMVLSVVRKLFTDM